MRRFPLVMGERIAGVFTILALGKCEPSVFFFSFLVLTITLVVVQCLRRRRTQFLVLIDTATVRALHGSQKDPWWGKVEIDTREDLG